MDRSPKCPKCATRIDRAANALPKEEWPMPEWPIYRCSGCGAYLEQSSRNVLYMVFGAAIIVGVAQLLGGIVGYLLSGGNELGADVVRWSAMAAGLFWLWAKPVRLIERSSYAQRG